jgi:hypothetical protein
VTEFKPSDRDVSRAIRSWLREDRHEDVSRVAGAVLDQVETTPQRRSTPWLAWRNLFMNNNVVRVGLVAAAVVIVAIVAINLLPGTPGPGGEPTPSPSAAESLAPGAAPSATASAYGMSVPGTSGGQSTLIVPPGWTRNGWYIINNNVFLSVWPVAVENVYSDPCHWQSSLLDPPVGPTVDELATALGNQAMRAATVEDVTLGGYSGKVVHQSLPADLDFTTCDLGMVGAWSEAGTEEPSRTLQSPGELDDVYIVDVEGVRVVVTASWLPSSAAATVTELEGMLDSLTIEP